MDVEADAVDRVERAQVERALWALPEAQRVAIALMDLGGFTAAEWRGSPAARGRWCCRGCTAAARR